MITEDTMFRNEKGQAEAVLILLVAVVVSAVIFIGGFGGGLMLIEGANAPQVNPTITPLGPTTSPGQVSVTSTPTPKTPEQVVVHFRLWKDLCGLPDIISVLYFAEKPQIERGSNGSLWYVFPAYYASVAFSPDYWSPEKLNNPKLFVVEARPAIQGFADTCNEFVLEEGTWVVTIEQ